MPAIWSRLTAKAMGVDDVDVGVADAPDPAGDGSNLISDPLLNPSLISQNLLLPHPFQFSLPVLTVLYPLVPPLAAPSHQKAPFVAASPTGMVTMILSEYLASNWSV